MCVCPLLRVWIQHYKNLNINYLLLFSLGKFNTEYHGQLPIVIFPTTGIVQPKSSMIIKVDFCADKPRNVDELAMWVCAVFLNSDMNFNAFLFYFSKSAFECMLASLLFHSEFIHWIFICQTLGSQEREELEDVIWVHITIVPSLDLWRWGYGPAKGSTKNAIVELSTFW